MLAIKNAQCTKFTTNCNVQLKHKKRLSFFFRSNMVLTKKSFFCLLKINLKTYFNKVFSQNPPIYVGPRKATMIETSKM